MRVPRGFKGFYAIALLVLTGPLVSAQSSNFDLVRIETDPLTATSASVLQAANGSLYAVGIVNAGTRFQTTPGALRAQTYSPTSPLIFVQKLRSDGSILASALVADATLGVVNAAVDSGGNVYIVAATQSIAGVPNWLSTGVGSGVIKIGPQLDRVLYATHVFGYSSGPMSIDLDTDGSAVVALVTYDNIKTAKLDPTGGLSFSYILTEIGGSPYDARWVGIAVAPDHTVWVGASPMFVYQVNAAGNQTMNRIALGSGKIQLAAMRVDRRGNVYAAGAAADPLPIPATPLDYTKTNSRPHTLIMKLDPNAASLYTVSMATATVTSLAVDASGNLWGAGGAGSAITIFQLDGAGTRYLHYLTVPADSGTVGGLALDGSGRALLAGSTNAIQLPDTSVPLNTSTFASPGTNAFLLRLKTGLPTASLAITLTPSASVVSTFGNVTYQATITNSGPAAATDVRIAVPPFVSSQTDINGLLYNCHASGKGVCGKAGASWRIAYDSLQPGESETVQFVVTIPSPPPSPFSIFLSAQTSTDDPNQLDNNASAEVAVETTYLNIQTSLPYLTLNVDNSVQSWAIGSFTNHLFFNPGVPAVTGSAVSVYVPTPQISSDGVYAFVGWSDGSTDNPRTFIAGTSSAVTLNMRKLTEPWVNPDAPVQHAASYRTGAIAPGEIVTLFGYNLGPLTPQQAAFDASGHVATTVSGFQVTFDGAAAPVIYTSAKQSSVIVPYSVAGKASVPMVISYNGLSSAAITVPVTDSAPGLLTANASGSGPLVAFNSDNSFNSRSNPVKLGDIIVLYGTGEGATTPLPADGEIAGSAPPKPQLAVSVTIAGQTADVIYAGGVTGITAGLLQLNVRVPATVPPGLLPVLLTVGTNTSQREGTIVVQ